MNSVPWGWCERDETKKEKNQVLGRYVSLRWRAWRVILLVVCASAALNDGHGGRHRIKGECTQERHRYDLDVGYPNTDQADYSSGAKLLILGFF